MLPFNQIYLGDSLELMNDIDDVSVDLIFSDLPYEIVNCAWDKQISLELLWKHYKRIIKPKGNIVFTAVQPFTSKIVNSNLDWFRYEFIW